MLPVGHQAVDKLLEQNRHARSGYPQTRSEAIAGRSERPSGKAEVSDEARLPLRSTLSL